MLIYCVRDKRNVPGTDCIATVKNGRKMLKCKSAVCGRTRTRLLPSSQGRVLARRRGPSLQDKMAYAAGMFLKPNRFLVRRFQIIRLAGAKKGN